MSDIRDRYPVGSPEWWINGHGLRRAGEDEIRRDERFLAAARPTPPKDEGERRDAAVNAGIQSRLTDRSVHTPTKLWGMEIDWSAICPNPGLHATRKFVDSQMAVWLTAADVYLPGVPSRECCEATGDFILGKSEAPGEFEECVRCRCMLVAHEVAWETAVRALPRGVPRPVEVECPPLDGNGVGLPRVLLRLALEADSVAAEAESCLGDQHVEPRVPITSGIGPLWDWLASLGPEEIVPGRVLGGRRVMLGPELGTFEITRVVSSDLMEVSMPSRRTWTILTRKEMVRALSVHNRDIGKTAPG